MKSIEHTGQIEVVDEQGRRHFLDEYTTFTTFRSTDGPADQIPGARSYELNGEHCNPDGEDAFITLNTEQRLVRV